LARKQSAVSRRRAGNSQLANLLLEPGHPRPGFLLFRAAQARLIARGSERQRAHLARQNTRCFDSPQPAAAGSLSMTE
jgi:hypothetical protein